VTAPPLPERPPGPMRLVLSAYPSEAAAARAVEAVLGRKLAACASSIAQRSRFWWQGRIESANEVLVVYKTAPKTVGALLAFVKRTHPYDVPEVAEVNVERAEPAYLRYLAETLDPSSLSGSGEVLTRRGAPRGRGARAPGRTRGRPPRRSTRTGRRS
jgi:periplasmic divalent cation tolerance protein